MLKKGSLGLAQSVFILVGFGRSFIGKSIFLTIEKMDFEKSLKNGQISPKSKEVNLNFLTFFGPFLRFFKNAFLRFFNWTYILSRKWTLKKVSKMLKKG